MMKQKPKGNSEKYPNIIWFHLDGIRPNRDFGDHKDKPYFLDNFSKKGVEYTNVYTAFPSTTMSISSVMLGYPPPYYTKCLENIDINTIEFKPLFHTLQEYGYETHSVVVYRPARKVLKNVISPIKGKFYAKGVKDYNYLWNSREANKTIVNFLKKKKLNKPYLLYLHYAFVGIKGDDSFNDARKMIGFLKKHGYFDNSIIIFWADHGWPAREKDLERGRLKRVLEGHDIILSNENVKVPLILIYPGCKPGLKINTPVSTLDIGPTLLKILGIKHKFGHPYFSKVLPLTEKKNKRIFRVDSRHYFQRGRKSCLVNNSYKYISHFNSKVKGEFYDLKLDPKESKNLIYDYEYQTQINSFKKELNFQEKDLLNFHVNYMLKKIKNKFRNKNIIIMGSGNNLFDKVVYNGFKKILKNVDLITKSNLKIKLKKSLSQENLIILPLNSPFSIYKDVLELIKKNKINYYYIDFNYNLIKKPNIFNYIFKKITKNWKAFITQPKVFLRWLLILYLRSSGKIT